MSVHVRSLQDVKSRFSEIVRSAESGDDTIVTRHGAEVAVVISAARYRELLGETRSVLDTLASAPRLAPDEVDLFERDRGPDTERPIELV